MLNFNADFADKQKAAIKPIFLLLHVPKEKESLPNIQTILFEIYAFLSFISDIRVAILDKAYDNSQIHNMPTLFNMVDNNINQLLETNEEEENSDSDSYFSSSLFSDEDTDLEVNMQFEKANASSFFTAENLAQIEVAEETKKNTMIYSRSKIIFLINDQTIQNADGIDECIDESEFFSKIKGSFNNEISLHHINTDDYRTYKGFLDHINDICMSLESHHFEMINNFKCIDDVSNFSRKYISINQLDEISLGIKQLLYDRYQLFKTVDKNSNPMFLLSFLEDEI